ncbi:MAG: PAS domain S-box protein [Sphingomonas sp.]
MPQMDKVQRFQASLTDEGRYRMLVESITDYAIYMLDLDGRVTNWNAGARRFKGYTAAEIVGEHFSRFYVEEDRAAGLPERALAKAARTGTFEAEGWRVRKNGERFWAHVVIDPIHDANGALVGYAKITRDLSERARAEESLRQSEEQFKRLVQSVTDYAIYMLDPNGQVVSWNIGAERIKGYHPDEIIGQHFSRFYSDEDRVAGEPARALETAVQQGRYTKEGWRVRKDGTHFRASVVIDPIRDDRGELIGFAKITRDITEREEAQREIERTREALAQSQKMDAIGQLTGGIAHDFNNLLMAALSSLTLLQKRLPDDPQSLRLLKTAVHAVERGTTLTQRMLAFARRQDLKPERVAIPTLVRGMTDLLSRSLGPSFTIETRFPLALGSVTADSNQLEMALLNLVVNARDAMPEGGTITIAARDRVVEPDDSAGLVPGRYVSLGVSDTGSGMDADTLARAMEPFFTTKGVGKGTGLGLSMVHGLAGQSGGRLMLESRLGEGTVADLWLPTADALAEQAMSVETEAEPPMSGRVLTVLVVDDDVLVLMNTAALLEDLGHRVLEANSGAEALDIFQNEPDIDLVITDQAMPSMTGIQLIDRIRTVRPDMPIVLATGYGELPPGADQNILKLGKPFHQRDLAKALVTALAA